MKSFRWAGKISQFHTLVEARFSFGAALDVEVTDFLFTVLKF